MQFRIVLNPDGSTQIGALEGTDETAKATLKALLAELGAGDVAFTQTSDIESHRHTPEEMRAHEHSHSHTH